MADNTARLQAADLITAIKSAGIRFIVALPDRATSEHLLQPMLQDPEQQEMTSQEELSQMLGEAVQLWLEKRRAGKVQREQELRLLRDAGLAMPEPRQRALAEAILPARSDTEEPCREHVATTLSQLHIPLSEESIRMRDEGA